MDNEENHFHRPTTWSREQQLVESENEIKNLRAQISDLERNTHSDGKHIKALEEQLATYEKIINIFIESPQNKLMGDVRTLEDHKKSMMEALGVNNPWPITDVLTKLIESTEYLLNVNNYDKHGWEEVSHCTKVGREILTKLNQALKGES